MSISPTLVLVAFLAQVQAQPPAQPQFPGTEVSLVDEKGGPISDATIRLKPMAPRELDEETLNPTPFPGFYFTDRIRADTTRVRVTILIPKRPGRPVYNNDAFPDPVPYFRRLAFMEIPEAEASLTIRSRYGPCCDPCDPCSNRGAPQPTFNPFLGQPSGQALPSGERVVVAPSNPQPRESTWATIPQRQAVHVVSAFRDGSLTPERVRIPFADSLPDLPVRPMPVVSADPQR
jgi:hypothetical protein